MAFESQAFTADLTMTSPPRAAVVADGRRSLDLEIARYYYDQREQIHQDAPLLRTLIEAVNWQNDLTPSGWAQWYSVALGFKPDLIVELGRGYGNSTAIFCQAASRLEHTRVVSVCNSAEWNTVTVPRLQKVVPPGWFDALDARVTDILDVDYETLLRGGQRVLFLWDAHGFQIAEVVLAQILPLLASREHLVVMHDISDTRYAAVPKSYEGLPIWKGSTFPGAPGSPSARVNIGWMNSMQDQVVAIADFAFRNDLEIGSADHAYAQFFAADRAAAAEMTQVLGDEMFSLSAHWAFLSLAGKEPLHFPAMPRRFNNQSEVVIEDLHPKRWFARSQTLPRLIETSGVPWEYAAVFSVRPSRDIPEAAKRSLRIRAVVEAGPAGIGLLNADQSAFVQAKRVLPAIEPQTVWLAIDDPAAAGPLVVHTWDTPERARVRIDEIAVVW
jgi:hypothetical protein